MQWKNDSQIITGHRTRVLEFETSANLSCMYSSYPKTEYSVLPEVLEYLSSSPNIQARAWIIFEFKLSRAPLLKLNSRPIIRIWLEFQNTRMQSSKASTPRIGILSSTSTRARIFRVFIVLLKSTFILKLSSAIWYFRT